MTSKAHMPLSDTDAVSWGVRLADAYRAIDALEPMPQHGPSFRLHHELFRVPLAIAGACLLLGLLWPRWKGMGA